MSGREPGPGGVVANDEPTDAIARIRASGLSRIHLYTWRDLESPKWGGSELHVDKVASVWAAAGLDVTLFTGAVPGLPRTVERHGYRVVRRGGQVTVFGHAALSGLAPRRSQPDALMEVFHGMPFFSPLWARCPHVAYVHHVHDTTWGDLLPGGLGQVGRFLEMRVAPVVYRRTLFVTGSESGRDDLVTMLGIEPSRVSVVHHGVDPRYTPGGARSPHPFVVAVGRLTAIKRFDLLVDTLVAVRREVPELRARIIGDGPERAHLEEKVRSAGADGWLELAGFVPDDELLDAYRSAWLVACTSSREGWNMTVTEAGACATPAVATDVTGHRDSVRHGVSGLLVQPEGLAEAVASVLSDADLRARLGAGALVQARKLTWEATAAGILEVLERAAAPGP